MRSSNVKLVAICGVALALAGQVFAIGKVTGVSTRSFADGTKLQIEGKDLDKPKVMKVGKTFILEFKADMPIKANTVKLDKDGLHAYSYFWFSSNPKLIRVQIWPQGWNNEPILTQNENGWLVSWPNQIGEQANAKPKTEQIAQKPVQKPIEAKSEPQSDALQSKSEAKQVKQGDPHAKSAAKKPSAAAASKPQTTTLKPGDPNAKPFVKKPTPKSDALKTESETKLEGAQAAPGDKNAKPIVKKAPTKVEAVDAKPGDKNAKPIVKKAPEAAKAVEVKGGDKDAKPIVKKEPVKAESAQVKTGDKNAKPAPKPQAKAQEPNLSPVLDSMLSETKKPVAATASANKAKKLVSLDFVNTDVVQILKALAMQSRVNVVTAPEVKGTVTVSLDRVTITQALDLVTTLAGLSYEWMEGSNTYIVASKDKIAGMKRTIEGTSTAMTSRVVPIYSGEGTQIKAAILRSVEAETANGVYEIALPSEETKVEKKTEDKPTNDPTKSGDNKETKVETKTTAAKDLYVVVLGSPGRVNEIAQMVRALDEQFCVTLGIKVPTSTAMVRKAYQVRGGSASELAKAVAGDSKKVGTVEISATPAGSKSEQAIVLWGRENEVDELIQTFANLDSPEQLGSEYLLYDVHYADPRALREAVVSQVPGLRATIPPASAGNPRLFTPGSVRNQAGDMVKDDPAKDPNNQANTGTAGTDPKVGKETGKVNEGLSQPFSDVETVGVPMRILLRGTAEQLRDARAYLQAVDIAPKQVALELRVMEMSKEDAQRFGIDWNIFTGGAVSMLRLDQSTINTPRNTGQIHIGGRNWGADITATLDSIADKQRMIARPNLLAIDGRESEIFVGDIVRYVASKSTNPTTGELNITINEIPVGVRLAVLPRVGGDGSLTMDLRPVVSSITGYLNAGQGVQIPQTSSRIAQSTVQIRSGETIAIGGLIQDSDVRLMSKVPILGDLPIIGRLFQRTENSKQRREVVFFLTAREVTAQDRGNAADPREGERRNPTEMPPLGRNGG